jgi:hypothetical protein
MKAREEKFTLRCRRFLCYIADLRIQRETAGFLSDFFRRTGAGRSVAPMGVSF